MGINTCLNIESVLLGHNSEFHGGYLVVTARYVVVTAPSWSLFDGYSGYCSLVVVTACYRSLLLGPTVSMNG